MVQAQVTRSFSPPVIGCEPTELVVETAETVAEIEQMVLIDPAAISADRRSVTVEVKDGGYGDADGVANGIIVDPAGLATTSTASTAGGGGGGGGGCFLTTIQNGSAKDHGLFQWVRFKWRRLLTTIDK
ncbi:MAG: hypothetical protein KFF68_00440 [Desulfosarcina sp.]|nr:hypothetical protein [Desulfosarcina sp.]